MNSFRKVIAITGKDILSELRTKKLVPVILVFAVLAIVIFNFALGTSPEAAKSFASGIIWTTFVFAGMLTFSRSFSQEMENGCLEGLMACPMSHYVIYLGKMLSNLAFMLVVEIIVIFAFVILSNLDIFSWQFLVIALLVTIGFVSAGTIASALAINTRTRELVLPLLLLPSAVPLVVSALKATELAISGVPWNDLAPWLQIIAAFDIIFIITSVLVFDFIIEE